METYDITFPIGNRTICLKIQSIDDLDLDDFTSIDYSNLIGEYLTAPLFLNKIGVLEADCREAVNKARFDLEILYAQLYEEARKRFYKEKANGERQSVSIEDIKNAVIGDKAYRLKKFSLITMERNLEYITSSYWSMKDKSNKLNSLYAKIVPEEFEKEIVEGQVNNVMIKLKDHLIQANH